MTLLNPSEARVVIYQGDDLSHLAELKRAADHAAGGLRADDGADEQAAYNAFLEMAAERAVEVVMHHIGSRRWRDLVMQHPPRLVPGETDGEMVEHEDDVPWGVNADTLPRALLLYRDEVKRTVIEPEFDDEETLAGFLDDEVSEGDFERLWISAFKINSTPRRSPKAFGQNSTESTT